MYLKKLEVHGFKSFADRTAVAFDPGITAIVGPNGCGKSNIVDAVRWVLGEQRARMLRSEKMENVIFNGTAKRRALGLAEVMLTIENTRGVLPTEYTEVTVGRRLYRSGDSEYLLNGVACRLRDIVDLFTDTGMGADAYSVIELKMVEEILSENANDRRRLFEEAAGITKYKMRRAQTLRKLDSTKHDLDRVRDLADELDKRVRSLKRQANKAARYRALQDELRTTELRLASLEHRRLTEEKAQLSGERTDLSDRAEAQNVALARQEADLEATRTALIAAEQAVAEAQRTLNAHTDRVRQVEHELRLEEERSIAAQRALARAEREQQEAADRETDLARTAATLDRKLDDMQPMLEQVEATLEQARQERDRTTLAATQARARLATLRRDAAAATDRAASLQSQRDRLLNKIELQEAERERLEKQAQDADAETQALVAREAETQTAADAADAAFDDAETALHDAEAKHERLRQARETTVQAVHEHARRRDALAAEVSLLESLVASFDEFSDAVRHLAEHPDWTATPPRTVADVLTCAPEHRLALQAALGDLAACFVVETEAEALAGIRRLRADERGQAAFFVLDHLPAPPPTPDVPADATPIRDLVRVSDPAFEPLAAHLVGRDVLVASLDAACTHTDADPALRFITPDGEWLRPNGLMAGGSATQSAVSGRFGRREQLEALQSALTDADAVHANREAEAEQARSALAAHDLRPFRQAVQDARRAQQQARQTADRAAYDARARAERQAERRRRATDLAAQIETDHTAAADLADRFDAAVTERDAARSQVEAQEKEAQSLEETSRAAIARYAEANVRTVEARNAADNLRRDRDRASGSIKAMQARARERAHEAQTLTRQLDEGQAKRTTLETQRDELHTATSALEQAVRSAEQTLHDRRAAIAEQEAGLRTLRREREQVMQQENQRDIRLAELDTRATNLLERIRDEYDLDLAATPAEVPDDFDAATARTAVPDLKQKLRAMGGVNALALEEYEEERDRLDFIESQQKDLEAAENTLLTTINEINTTASQRFDETFTAVRTHFQRLFTDLFGEGAAADLVIEGDDPLEANVEIHARPRGKKPSVLSQLSGGEKTLTAIALLFAIYLVKPSPFCILDEVDAPLDDANVERFMALIRAFSTSTQFILVTHNKLTMEAADRMYGVTMQEQGVSQLVGVNFGEIELEAA